MRSVYVCMVLLVLMASCAFHANNWQGTSVPGVDKASFNYFNGKNTSSINLQQGDLLFTDYTVNVIKGTVTITITQQNKVLWNKVVSGNDTANFYVTAPETGDCKMIIKGNNAEGGFDLHYRKAAPHKVSVKTSKNIELYGLITHLDDMPDIIKRKDTLLFDGKRTLAKEWYSLGVKNYDRYKQFDTCKIMAIYRKMETEGYFYDFFVGFLLQVDEAPNARINPMTDNAMIRRFSKKGDTAEARSNAELFLAAFNDFYREVDFDSYLANIKPFYDQANADVSKNLPGGDLLPVMEHYYRKQFNHYYLVPSPNILTGMGFGILNRSSATIYNSFGPFSFQSLDNHPPVTGFDYPEKIKGLAVHEFGHSFANPAIDNLPQSLIDSTAFLYEPIKKQMSKLAYTAWVMSLNEHLVRVGEVIIAEKLGDSARAKTIMQDNIQNGFKYLPFLVAELKAWDKNPSSGTSFNDAVLSAIKKLKTAYPE